MGIFSNMSIAMPSKDFLFSLCSFKHAFIKIKERMAKFIPVATIINLTLRLTKDILCR